MVRSVAIRDRVLQSRDAIELLSAKWRIPILHLLQLRPLRTGKLQKAMEEVSPKVLTQTLRGLAHGRSTKNLQDSRPTSSMNY